MMNKNTIVIALDKWQTNSYAGCESDIKQCGARKRLILKG